MTQSIKSYEEAVAFHGHACPGLALGYRAAEYALQHYRACVWGGKFVCMPCAGSTAKGDERS
jgi:formylmethanofuran dehydrogenase subunit E